MEAQGLKNQIDDRQWVYARIEMFRRYARHDAKARYAAAQMARKPYGGIFEKPSQPRNGGDA